MTSNSDIFQQFNPGDRFIYNGNTGTVFRLSDQNEGGADFYFDETNYVVQMDDDNASTTYYIRGIKIMSQNDMKKI